MYTYKTVLYAAAQDGSLHGWPDGELITPEKLAALLKEDILRRVQVPRTNRQPRFRPRRQQH